MTLVVDASLMVSAFIDEGAEGSWAQQLLGSDDLAAPHLMPVEATNILRRGLLADRYSEVVASLTHWDMMSLPVELFPFEPFAYRAWELRHNVTSYDAWYVALAESLGAPLATLDRRLAQAAGPHCEFVTLPAG